MNRRVFSFILALGIVVSVAAAGVAGQQFRIAIMQDQPGMAEKFKPVLEYLAKKGVPAVFVTASDYPSAAGMFSIGGVDGMFSGSGVAGFMIMKGLARPTVRPLTKEGYSTYWAVVIAKKGAPKFTYSDAYFKGKKVAFTSLASSGDFYFHSLPGSNDPSITEMKMASHGDAIEAVEKGQADVAIVKNRVWDSIKHKYPELVKIGEDKGENPDNTLIVAKDVPPELSDKIASILLGLKDDSSAEAMAVKSSLGIQGFIKTTQRDFNHTIPLLKKAGVEKLAP